MNNNRTTRPRPLPLPPGQRQPQPAQPHVAQQSRLQVPPAPAYNQQRTVSQPSRLPPPEQSAFYTNDYYGSQRPGQQDQYQVPPPVARSLPQLVAQPNYNSYQPTPGYPRHYVPQPVTYPQSQIAYYPHPQPEQQQQQQRLYHTPPQHLMQTPARGQRFDSPNLNRQAQRHAPLSPQPQFEPPLPLARNTRIYSGQNQGPSGGDGRSMSMSGNRGEIPDKGRGGSHMDSGDGGRRAGQSSFGVHAHWSGGKFGGATSVQAEGRNTIPTSTVPAATQFQHAQNVNVSGNPILTNIGTNTGVHNMTTVNNYGGTHGLEKLEKSVSFAALHDSAEQDPDRRCHPGTRKTVLTRLRHWFGNPNPTDRIFWLHGPAGAGKSAIAQTIADEYKKRGVAATFFFYRSDPMRNNGKQLFPTIAWQLAFSIPPTKDFIVHALDKTPQLPTQGVESQFEKLVVHSFHPTNNIASQMSHRAPVVIIDGVDECSDEKLQQRLLAVIGNAIKNQHVPLRFLIVSRPEALIEETLDKFKDFTVSIDLAKLDDSHHDIQMYLEDKFLEITSNRGLDPTWPGQEIIQEIVSQSSGNFILPSTLVRFISDEDYSPESQLDIIRKLKPHGKISPFALLDELYLEILKRPPDQDFLKTFLALLVARSSVREDQLHKDDAMLMNVSEKDLHIRLRRMRSLLKFEPFIDVYHKSFLDFLQDPSRSGQYHVSKEGGIKRYLELIVDSVVRHVSMASEQPNCREICNFSPVFHVIVTGYPPMIVLPVEGWQDALKPLLDLQDKLLKTSRSSPCCVPQVMRDLLLHLVILQGKSHIITAAQAPESNMNETVTERGPALVTEAQQSIREKDLDSCLSALLLDSVMVVDRAMIDRMFSLLAFDHAETVARVRTLSDAQKLIDLIDLLTNNESFLSQCGRDAARKAAHLARNLFAKTPLLPQSLFLNKRARYMDSKPGGSLEYWCRIAFISRILDHNYIVPVLGIFDESNELWLGRGNKYEQDKSIDEWLKRSRPNLVTRIRVILEVAKTIRYIHSMDVVLSSHCIDSKHFFLDSNLCAKFEFIGSFEWSGKADYEYNISAFASLFQEVCFGGHNENLPNLLVEPAMQLIKQCHAKDWPTMKDVVKEMETWNLTYGALRLNTITFEQPK